MENLKWKLLDWLPYILISIPFTVMFYIKYGNPSERFFELANTISLWIFLSPMLFFLLAVIVGLFYIDDYDKCNCCCKCHCCKCCSCCKGEK